MAFQLDGSREEMLACGHDDPSPTLAFTAVYRLLYSLLIISS